MSQSNPSVASQNIMPINDTAASPSISWGGGGGLGSNSSGTGLYGDLTSVKVAVGGSLLATLNSSGLTLASGAFIGNITGNITGNVTGNLTGNVTGNVTGSLSGGSVAATNLSVSGTCALNTTNSIVVLNAAGAPTDGTTGAAVAGPGSLYIDITAGVLYINTNTKVSPTWTIVGTQS